MANLYKLLGINYAYLVGENVKFLSSSKMAE